MKGRTLALIEPTAVEAAAVWREIEAEGAAIKAGVCAVQRAARYGAAERVAGGVAVKLIAARYLIARLRQLDRADIGGPRAVKVSDSLGR